MEKKSKKRKLIGFIAGEKGSIGKLQALALGIGGLIAGGLIPKIAQAWDNWGDSWSGDWGDSWSGDWGNWGDAWSGDWSGDSWDNTWSGNSWDNDWSGNSWDNDWSGNSWDNTWSGDWPTDWPTDWDYTWPSDWENTWSGDYINYTPTQEPVPSIWDSGGGPYPSIGSGQYDSPGTAEGNTTLVYVYEYDADGNITGGQEVIVHIVSVGDEVPNGGAWYAIFSHPSWQYDHMGLITAGGGGGGGGGWSGDWPANTAPSAEVEIK